MASPADHDAAERIATAVRRLEDAVGHRPGFGHSTSTSTTTLVNDLRCVTREGEHRIETDLTAALGGHASGPTPSVLLRAALGSCLAMGYRLRAARHGVPVAAIRVAVETDSAIAGMLDPGSAFPPGFIEVRYRVEIDSSAAGPVEPLIDEADRLSPVLDALTRVNRVTRLAASPASAAPGGRR
jgi:uncharacterized OsmC-like protein